MMLEHGPNLTQNPSMSSQADSHVKTFHTREKEQDSQESEADCSMKQCESFASWDQESLSWRTSQRCLLEGWETFSGRWPRSGMMRNGIAYRLPPLVPRTSGTGRSSWATPTVHNATSGGRSEASARKRGSRCLQREVRMYPTPAARDWKSGKGRKENGHSPQLPEVIGGQLNPPWVEWLMGFPEGWTDLEGSETQ
jgi:hypothetical protein